jgi:iron complex outermembrane recepter protein
MKSIILRTILLTSTLPFSMPSHSDLEEIIVTGLKRAQNRDQVMSSVSVLNEITIQERVIDSFEDVVNNTEGVHLTESGQSTQLRIRGIGSGNSQGFEQSVAQYQDGVFMGRPQLFRAPLYDLKAVEVFRGVQNTMFVKTLLVEQ